MTETSSTSHSGTSEGPFTTTQMEGTHHTFGRFMGSAEVFSASEGQYQMLLRDGIAKGGISLGEGVQDPLYVPSKTDSPLPLTMQLLTSFSCSLDSERMFGGEKK